MRAWRPWALGLAALGAACATPALVFVSPDYGSNPIARVAVLDFSDYPGQAGSGAIASDVFEQFLLPLGYNLVERKEVDQILKEQSFQASSSVDPATAQSMGKILGVDALVVGSVTDFAQASEQTVMVDDPQEVQQPIYGQAPAGRNGWGGGQTVVTGYTTTEVDQQIQETETLPAEIGLSVRMVGVKSGTVLWTASASCDGANVSDAAQSAAESIASGLQDQLKKLAPPAHG
jgi:hypothetical protein